MSKRKGSFLKTVLVSIIAILILSSYGITLRQLVSLEWTSQAGDLIINFFTN